MMITIYIIIDWALLVSFLFSLIIIYYSNALQIISSVKYSSRKKQKFSSIFHASFPTIIPSKLYVIRKRRETTTTLG